MISLTAEAAEHIKDQITKRGRGKGIRLGVKTSGCSGFGYILEFVDELHADDVVFKDQDVNLVVDKKNLLYLDGCQLELVTEGLNSGIQFNNPKATSHCGCGESFSTSD